MRRLLGPLIALLLCAGTALATSPEIAIYLDRRPLDLPVPAKLVDGRTMVPLRAVAEALGVQVDWLPTNEGGVVHLSSYPLHFSPPVGWGSAMSFRSTPANPQALGANAALIQYLAAQQANSLTGESPTLVRFELLDLRDGCFYPPPPDLADWCAGGFQFAVRLYYSEYADQAFPLGVAAYQRVNEGDSRGWSGVERAPSRSWYEDQTLWVRPVGESLVTGDLTHAIVQHGRAGWAVDESSRSLVQSVELDQRFPFLIHGSFGR